ncbi:MAG: spore coat associated protein CotJA [Clostridia bacterium]
MIDHRAPETYFQEPEQYMMPDMPYMPGMYQVPQMQPVPGMYCPPAGPCIPQETAIHNVRLATAYVPFQKLCDTYAPIEGFSEGTIFPELLSPYMVQDKRCMPPLFD